MAIKVGGKVVRELNPGYAKVPFGSEYSVYFKNLADRPCTVKVWIDGQDVLKGKSLIVKSNSSIDLERYLDTINTGNKFKFIAMTDSIAENRGVKTEDGIVRIEWQFEQKVVVQEQIWYTQPVYQQSPIWYHGYDGYNYPVNSTVGQSVPRSARTLNNISVGSSFGAGVSTTTAYASASAGPFHDGSATMNFGESTLSMRSLSKAPQILRGTPNMNVETQTSGSLTSTAGFTTKGDISDQKFRVASIGALESTKYSACLYLVGTNEEVITTKDKLKCEVCGVVNNYAAKFCNGCGTYISKDYISR